VKRSPRERCGIEAIAEAEDIRGTSWTRRESFAASAERKFAPSETQSRRARFCVLPSIEQAANEPLNEPTISASDCQNFATWIPRKREERGERARAIAGESNEGESAFARVIYQTEDQTVAEDMETEESCVHLASNSPMQSALQESSSRPSREETSENTRHGKWCQDRERCIP